MNAALSAAATLVAFAFALSTLDRWLRRRRPHELAWTISLSLFTLGSGALWWAESAGWSLASFRVFYLAGAVLNVPWLALGTVYLLAGEQIGTRVRAWLLLLSGFTAGVVLFAPTRSAVSGNELPTGKDVFGVAPRVLAALGSGVAAVVIIAGALWSAWRVSRGRAPSLAAARSVPSPRSLVTGNLLIAAGTVVLSASGTLAGRLGKDRAFAITLLAGISILFAGFLVAGSSRRSLHTAGGG
jgi:type IV secretory pathway TrbD component